MPKARYTITIGSEDYLIKPGTFVEGAVRRQAEFQQLGADNLQSRPDRRQFWQTSWLGGAEWERPVYSEGNLNTYYDAAGFDFTNRAGSAQIGRSADRLAITGFTTPEMPLISTFANSKEGAVTLIEDSGYKWYQWDASASVFVDSTATSAQSTSTPVMCGVAHGDDVFVQFSDGAVAYWDTSGTTTGLWSAAAGSALAGSAMWADNDYVWVYNGDAIWRHLRSTGAAEKMLDDDDGYDALSSEATYTDSSVIPKSTQTRAMVTSEGIFYVKNVSSGGANVAKVYRGDRDASGAFILTPVGTLPVGAVAINITYHLGSIIISSVPNYAAAIENTDDQRVTFYHITGNSIGAIGSPLGTGELDETPVWFLLGAEEQLYFGGRKRFWQYDARLGAFHPLHLITDTGWVDHGSGLCEAVPVPLASGNGWLVKHGSLGAGTGPYLMTVQLEDWDITADFTSNLESNWFDFDVPTESKSVIELFYDITGWNSTDQLVISLCNEDESYSTVATLVEGTDPAIGSVTLSTPKTGTRFAYKAVFAPTATSTDPSRLISIGFTALSGDMVDVLQFTIDGNESVNIENNVQIPYDVYAAIATLRDTKTVVSVTHTYASDEADDTVTGNFYVASVTGNKESPAEGEYEVVLVAV